MRRLTFTGTIRPERAVLSIGKIAHEIQLASGNKCVVMFDAYNNQLTAVVECDYKEDIYTLRNVVKSTVELVTDIIGFIRGYAYDVEVVKVVSEDLSLSHVFGIDIPALAERNKGVEPEAVNHVYPLCMDTEGMYLKRALSDLAMAMRHADDTAFYCFRAIESLKQFFAYRTGRATDKEQWTAMAAALGDYKDAIEPIRTRAFPARHGIPPPTTDEERKNMFFTAWEIVEAFVNFRLKETGSNYKLQPTQNASGALRG